MLRKSKSEQEMKSKKLRHSFKYASEQLRAFNFPLGGIGTGHMTLSGDGGLRQWQIFNSINHNAHVPFSFFAVSIQEGGRKQSRILQSKKWYDSDFEPAPSVSDHVVPQASRDLLEKLRGVDDLEFIAEYPVVQAHYALGEAPIELSLEAYSPFVPLDADDSGLPAIVFHFTATNKFLHPVTVSLLMSQQNAVGWDDATEINGIAHPSFGGNTNKIIRTQNATTIVMENENLSSDAPRYGQMLISALDTTASARAQWTSLDGLWQDFTSDGSIEASAESEPSPSGQTVNAALCSRATLQPGECKKITFLLVWYFPNRYVDWTQPTLEGDQEIARSKLWLGNYYSARFGSAFNVAEYVREKLEYFDETARNFREALHGSTFPAALIEAVSSQISVVRSPTCFRAADGRFYAFEGCCGASTELIAEHGGCCPLNCTHVWNYAMTPARLFPQLELSMRETEWFEQQHETGYLPHRVVVPLSLRRPWDRWIGGPPYPAVDGLLGAVLKTYREFKANGKIDWLRSLWDHVRLAMDHLMTRYDNGKGIVSGPQPCTYDVEIYGPNSFTTSLYLASLRAAEEMARTLGDAQSRKLYRERFRIGKDEADRLLWRSDYYIHVHDTMEAVQAYGIGCHSDQLFGQWWAHILELGYILPRRHVRKALFSVVRYNWREQFFGHDQFPRKYLKDEEPGLLNCTWPKDEKPDTPLLYSDEIWTGIEYEVAGALLFEGMVDESLKILESVRKRQDGRFRSPWNEIECGDHYVRAMSSWALLEAASGFSYDASKAMMKFEPRIQPDSFSSFFATGNGWGTYAQNKKKDGFHARLSVLFGLIRLRELRLEFPYNKNITVRQGKRELPVTCKNSGGICRIHFHKLLEIGKDEFLRIIAD
jgi:non-lysosomal glucosylceramidase